MPARSTGGTGTSRRQGTRTRRGMGGSPWQPVVDAAYAVAQRFGDPVAMEGVNALDTAGDAIEHFGQALQAVGQTSADAVAYDPRVVPFFAELGQYVIAAAEPARLGAAAVRRAHAEQIRRIEENDRRQRRWDIGAHD